MSLTSYVLAFAVLVGGLMYGAYLIHLPEHLIGAGANMLLGVGILAGVRNMRHKDAASS